MTTILYFNKRAYQMAPYLKNNKIALIGGTIGALGSGAAVKYGYENWLDAPSLESNILFALACVTLVCLPSMLFCAWIGSMFDNLKISQDLSSIEGLDYSQKEEFIDLKFQNDLKKTFESLRRF